MKQRTTEHFWSHFTPLSILYTIKCFILSYRGERIVVALFQQTFAIPFISISYTLNTYWFQNVDYGIHFVLTIFHTTANWWSPDHFRIIKQWWGKIIINISLRQLYSMPWSSTVFQIRIMTYTCVYCLQAKYFKLNRITNKQRKCL